MHTFLKILFTNCFYIIKSIYPLDRYLMMTFTVSYEHRLNQSTIAISSSNHVWWIVNILHDNSSYLLQLSSVIFFSFYKSLVSTIIMTLYIMIFSCPVSMVIKCQQQVCTRLLGYPCILWIEVALNLWREFSQVTVYIDMTCSWY